LNRILLVCNAILALLLAIRLVNTGSPALAADKPAPWCAEDLRLVAAEFADLVDAVDRPRPGGILPAKVEPTIFLLHLGAEVAPAPLSSSPVEIGLVGEPQLELVTAWQSSSILRVAVQSQLLPATNYQLRFSRELESLDGRTLPAGSAVALTTPNVQLRDVLIEDDAQVAPGRGDAGLRVRLSLPVDLAMAEQCLGLRDAETGADLPARVELVDGGAGHLFRVRMQKGELPPVVRVVLHQGCVPKRGKLPLEREQVRTIDVYEPLDLRAATATQRTLDLTFNRAIPVPDAKFVTLTPACSVQYETTPRGLRIRGDFAPGTLVAIDLAPGFPGKGRSSLGITAHRTVLVPDLEPSVDILGDGEILSARAEPILTLRGCNASKVTVRLRRVYANNVVRMMQHSDARVFEPAVERELSIAMVRNVEWQERMDLREVLGGEPRGIYQVEVWREGQYWPSQRLLQITDLGVTVRAGDDRAAVQVVSIADGSPCADAQVTIVTPTNQELVTGRTDAEGKVLLSWQSGSPDRKPFLVQVQYGDDRVFVGMDRCGVELAEEGLGGRAYLRDGIEAMVWPSRGIVRPGESFDIAVLVRDATGAAAVDRDLSVVFTAPGGKESRRQRIRSNGSGLFSAKLELPADAPCGRWSASVLENDAPVPGHSLALGQASFEVATFVPNRLEAVANVLGEVHHGAPLVVHVQGNWLDGTPADGRPVQVRVRLDKTAFTPKELADYSFASGIDQPPPGELPAVDAVLDEHGVAELRLQLPPQGAEQMLMATVFAEVLDPSGRPVRAQTQHLVVSDVFAVGVRARDGHVDVRGVAADGSLVGDGPCTVRIERRHWEWRYDARGTNRWSWRSFVEKEVVQEAEVTMAGGIASIDLSALEERGWLAAIVTHGEQRAEQVLGAAPRAPDRLRVRTTNNPAPGEMARIDVDSPAAGRGFVTLESDTVWSANIVMLEAGDNHIEVPVPADARLPNLHAVVTLTRPAKSAKAGDGPAWLVGAADVRLRREELAAAVQLVVASEVLPQANLHVSIEAAEANLATVAVVDEGVLGVTGHPSPDPLAFVLASRALTVDGADTGSRLVRDMMFVPRTKTGGDDDELGALLRGGSVDTHIRPLALFAEVPLTLGKGAVDFVLPAYEGRVRVMVIAAGPQRLGSAAAEVVVKAPLGLQVAVPRMVAPGDRFVIPVSLRNDLGKDVEVAVDIAVPESLTLPGGTHYQLPIAVGRTANVDVAVVAAAVEGPQSFAVTASAGGQVRTVSEVIAVRSLRLPERASLGFRLGEEQTLRVAEGWSNDLLHAEISVDVSPDRQLRPALEAMLEYPYGCCEQTASRGMALATCAALLPRLYDDPRQMPQVLPLVQAAVDRVFAMQSSLGGFGWWLGARNDDAFLTIHVMDFLVQAREVGAQVSEVGFLRAKARLLDLAAEAYDVDARCHAIEVLARLGEVVQPRLDWLCAQPVSLEARARLATALALLGERRRASDLLQHGDEAAPFAAEDNHRERLDSPIRAQALLLRAQLAIDPGHASLPGQVAALQRQLLRPRFLTTQELAQGLRALADYYRRQPVSGKAAHATVLVDGAAMPVEGGHTVDLPIHAGSTVTLAAGGEGFVLLNVQGYAPPVAHDDARMALRREIVDLETGLPTTKLRRGRVYEVRIHAELAVACRDVVVADVLPAGCEAEPVMPGDAMGDEADRDADGGAVLSDAGHGGGATKERTLEPLSREPRDDRVLMFFGAMPSGRLVLRHRIRAVFPGDYESPPVTAQGMYDATLQVSELSALRVEIVP
jgi:alpha-2-macroglobulin